MGKQVKISIIVPVYNAEKFLERAMNSIYSQTFTDYEIILVDDGSTDNSANICQEYAKRDDRITYIHKENGGAGSARNMGIEVAVGEYLAFPDVDDWFESDMYGQLYELAKSGDYDLVTSGANCYKEGKCGLEKTSTVANKNTTIVGRENCRKKVMEFFPTSLTFDVPWNKLYKRKTVMENNVRFTNARRCQDAMFNIDFYNVINSIASTEKAYYNYILNNEEGINRKFPKNYIDFTVQYFEKLISILQSWGVYDGAIREHYDTSFVISVYGTMSMFENKRWAFSKSEKAGYVKSIMARREVSDFIADAVVRQDAVWMAEIIKGRDYSGFIRRYKREKCKNRLRKNPLVMWCYRLVRK